MNALSFSDSHSTQKKTNLLGRVGARIQRKPGFFCVVLVPTLLTAIYYATYATPQYVSEAQFIVQGQKNQSNIMLSGLLEAGNGTSASEDTYAVQDYVVSRDAAKWLIKNEGLKEVFSKKNADIFSKFPNFYSGKTFEHFFSFYKRHVIADLDTTSGVSTIQVRTFDPNDSQRIASALVKESENLINKMNNRQRENTISASLKEYNASYLELNNLNNKISSFRNEISMINPNSQSAILIKSISALQDSLIETRIQIDQMQTETPNNPLIKVYNKREEVLKNQIFYLEKKITGSDSSFVPKINNYEKLIFNRKILEKSVSIAAINLSSAKAEADKKLLYLNEITQPNLPDYASYPKSIPNTIVVFLTMLGIYIMSVLIINGAREHKIV